MDPGVQDQSDLLALVHRYAVAVDDRDKEALAALFVPEATMDIYLPGRDEPVARLRGVGQLGGVLDALSIYSDTMHFVANCFFDIDGDEATGTAYCVAHHLLEGEPEGRDEQMFLSYEDAFVRTEEGWRFAHRRLRRRWTSSQPAGQAPLEIDLKMAGRRA